MIKNQSEYYHKTYTSYNAPTDFADIIMFQATFSHVIFSATVFCRVSRSQFCIVKNKTFLTYYYTMPHFDVLKIYSCRKHCKKRRNFLKQAISPFLTLFSNLYGTYFPFQMHFNLRCRLQFASIWTSQKFCSLTSAEACEKSSRWLWNEKLCQY